MSHVVHRLRSAWPTALASCLFAALAAAPGDKTPEVKQRERELDQLCKALKISPITLDRPVVKAGEQLAASCVLENISGADVTLPLSPGAPAGTVPRFGGDGWHLRYLDAGGKAGEREYIWGSLIPSRVVKQGEKLAAYCHIDPSAQNLRTGNYELTVDFSFSGGKLADGAVVQGRVIGQASARFRVENPNRIADDVIAKQRKQEAADLAAKVKAFYGAAILQPLELSARTVKQGASVEVFSSLKNTSRSEVPCDWVDPVGKVQWYVDKVEGGSVPSGDQRKPHAGDVVDIPARKLLPGQLCQIKTLVPTADLEPGTYEVCLEIQDSTGKLLSSRKTRFKVTK